MASFNVRKSVSVWQFLDCLTNVTLCSKLYLCCQNRNAYMTPAVVIKAFSSLSCDYVGISENGCGH